MAKKLRCFLDDNEFKNRLMYSRLEKKINIVLTNTCAYRISIDYISYAGNHLGQRVIVLNKYSIDKFKNDPSLLMGKGEYSKYLKEQQKETLSQKHSVYYERVNNIIDYANDNKDAFVIKGSQVQLDGLIAQLFDRTVNSIKKIKNIDSEEWGIIENYISRVKGEIEKIVNRNRMILDYYESFDFLKIKDTCEALMGTQREFNEYINEKIQFVSKLFGVRIVRNQTINEDKYSYIRPYKKEISPFTAEVSAKVFASAENKP